MWGRDAAVDEAHDIRQGELMVIEPSETIETDRVYRLGPSWSRKGRKFVLLDTTAVEIGRNESRVDTSRTRKVIEVSGKQPEEFNIYATDWKAFEVERCSLADISKVSSFVKLRRNADKVVLIPVIFVTRG